MKIVLNYCLLICLLLTGWSARAQNFSWAQSVYNTQALPTVTAQTTASAIDRDGNMYVAGRSFGSIQVGPQTITMPASNVLNSIIKYAPSGAILNVQQFYSSANQFSNQFFINHLETDTAGNLYATGSFTDTISINGNQVGAASGQKDFFVAKWNAGGALQWITTGNGNGQRDSRTITADLAGNVFIAGSYTSTSVFGGFVLPASNSLPHSFVAKLSAAGTILWAMSAENGTNGSSRADNIGTDLAGNIYLQGSLSNSISWDNIGLTAAVPGTNTATTYWVRLNASGDATNGFVLPAPQPNNQPASMVTDQHGNTYFANQFTGTLNLGGITLIPAIDEAVYVAKYNSSGILQWAQQLQKTDSTSLLGGGNLAIDHQDRLYLAGVFTGDFLAGSIPVSGPLSSQAAYAIALDKFTGNALWAMQSGGAGMVLTNRIAASETGQVALSGNFTDGAIMFDTTFADASFPNATSFFAARISQNFNIISGKIFADTNGNSVQDAGEVPLQNNQVVVEVNPGAAAFNATSTGDYYALTGAGTSTVTLPNPPLYYNVVAVPPAVVNFADLGNTAGGYNFALQPVANQQDLQVFVTPLMPVRPGFTTTCRVTYKNVGTVAIPSGSVGLSFDPLLTYLSSQPAGSISGSTLAWTYTNLLPGQSRNINVVLSVPASATIGDSVIFAASVLPLSGDLTPADNSETISRIITASFDPNKIEVNLEAITPAQVQTGQWLYYTIHFQNMGTDTAFTVMLRDSLPVSLLNMGTLQMVAASNNIIWSIGATGILTVTFNNIRLPHKGINSIGSHGFARFRIKPKPGLTVGEIIPNQAKIYFDYNPYIATNTATTEVKQPSGISAGFLPDSWKLYPNPAHDKLTIQSQISHSGQIEIALVNVLGQEVLKTSAPAGNGLFMRELNLQLVPKGMYFVKIKTEAGTVSKPVVRH